MQNSNSTVCWTKIDSFIGNSTAPQLTRHRPCPICGSLKSNIVLQLNNFQFYSDSAEDPKRVDLCQNICLDCFALYLNPCYTDYGFRILFAEAGQSYGSTDSHVREQVDWLTAHGLLRRDNSVLDIGCYDGAFLALLPKHIRKVGVDIDRQAIERGRALHREHDIEFVLGSFERFEFRDAAPNTITMFHVLEHLERPVDVLRHLRLISNPHTSLVVEVPILENGTTNGIPGFFSIQHMTHFSFSSLDNCFKEAGWKIEVRQDQQDYNGCRVLATPIEEQPIEKSTMGDSQDWARFLECVGGWYGAIANVEARVEAIPSMPRMVIWGGGAHTEFLYQVTTLFHGLKNREYAIVDNDPLKHGKTWRGVRIAPPSLLKHISWDDTVLLISSYGSQDAILFAARAMEVPENRVIHLYDQIRRY
jgi:ubiquinone/menaquinone biosynthesis C-methylase UbiE